MFYSIEEGRYTISITCYNNIADVPDDFLSQGELDTFVRQCAQEGRPPYYLDGGWKHQLLLRTNVVAKELEDAKHQLTSEGKRSVNITDELTTILSKRNMYISDFVDGLRRRGNKVYLDKNVVKRQQRNEVRQISVRLVTYAIHIIEGKFPVRLVMNINKWKISDQIDFLKKLVSKEEITNWAQRQEDDDVEQMVAMWDNPYSFFPKDETKPQTGEQQ